MKRMLLIPLLALCALALPATAAEAVKISNVANSIFFRGGGATRGSAGFNGGNYSSQVFDGNFSNPAICNMSGTTELVVDVSHIVTDPDGEAFVTEVVVAHQGNSKYSLYYTTEAEPADILTYGADPRTWLPIDGASNVQEQSLGDAAKVFGLNKTATAVKYVFESFVSWTGSLAEIEVRGYEYIPAKAVKISALNRSIFFRGGGATRGNAGFNGGNYSDMVFDGNFSNPAICNMSGTTELVIPTTGWDSDNNVDTGVAWYVTDFKVAHQGNSKYSLYYTTEAEPADILTYGADPRTWIPIDGASMVQEQSLGDAAKVFGVNKTATAVKYVFESFVSWTASLAEVEVWAMDPSTITCLHENFDPVTATWTLCTFATCTENAMEEAFCPDCGERFEREVPLSKLGHVFVATLTEPGSVTNYGSGYVSCSRTIEDPDTHTNIWSCDFRINFAGEPVDLTTLGGLPINGVVQYTDLTASSTGGLDGGIAPDDVMDGVWANQWNGYWFAEGLSHDEYIQYKFGTTIELTKLEFSVLNQFQTVDFYKFDPATEEETLIKSIPLKKDETDGAPGYIRQTVYFFNEGEGETVTLDAIRMRIGDYVDPVTGETTAYIGEQYGRPRHTCIIEFHPYGTIAGAGKKNPGQPMFILMQ